MGRIYISAGHKSSGKTTLSIGLCAALSQQGKKVQAFKKGPDYIDPLWLANASSIHSKRECFNLDFNTQSPEEIIHTLNHHGHDADISLIEGNKGLYDGVALDGSDSNAAMAKLTKSPVILIIDSRGVTRGVAPLLLGYQCFDEDIEIAGVIYNFCGGARHERKLRAVTEEYTDIPVLGMLRKSSSMDLAERHLGLMPSNETKDAKQRISEIAQFVTGSVDLSKVITCASQDQETIEIDHPLLVRTQAKSEIKPQVTIGICEDAAFGFYYADDKRALIDAGAELVSIDTLKDKALPKNLDGLFIGGGFPETQMEALEDNVSMRESIFAAIEAGLPTYAECGGLMYLSESIQWKDQSAKMVGSIPAIAVMNKKPQGRGYVQLQETSDMLWKAPFNHNAHLTISKTIHAHEFHYSSLLHLKEKGKFAYKVTRGIGITGKHDGWVYKHLIANYSHIRHTKQYPWANRFIEFVRSKVNTRKTLCQKTTQFSEIEL